LRKNKWIPRREEAKAKTIGEVRQEALLEEEAKRTAALRGVDTRRSSGRGGLPSLAQQPQKGKTTSSGLLPKPKMDTADLSKLGTFQKKDLTQTTFAPPQSFKKRPTSTGAPLSSSGSSGSAKLGSPPGEQVDDDISKTSSKEHTPEPRAEPKAEVAESSPAGKTTTLTHDAFLKKISQNLDEYFQVRSLEVSFFLS